MSYIDKKITQEEINAHHVQGATDHLIGNAQQNKAVFDDLPEFIAGKHNELIDELNSHHGDEIKVAVDEWLAEHPEVTTTVQDNSLTTAKYVDGSVTEPKIAEGAVTRSKLDRAYSTPADLASVNANLTNELNVLDARMDEFASLPEGSTTADAELVDIRAGADGTTYPTAGDAVREQVADLKSDLKKNINGNDTINAWENNIAINVGSVQGFTYNGITIKCFGNGFTLSGTSTNAVAFPLNNPSGMHTAFSGYTSAFKSDRLCKSTIVAGHNYKIIRKLIKGTVTKGGTTYTPDTFPDGSGEHLVNVALFAEDNTQNYLTSPASGIINASTTGIFCVYVYSGVTFSDDATFLAYLVDLDADNTKGIDFVTDAKFKDVDERLDAIETSIGSVPSYWNAEINASVESINNNIASNDINSVSIAFITDCHWNANKKHSPAIMKEILERCNIRYFINGGDILEASTTKVKAIQEITDIMSAFKICRLPMITLYGNHDRNRYASDSNQFLSLEEHWNLVFKAFDSNDITWVETYKAFYWEDTAHRYICLYWWSSDSRVESFVADVCNTDKQIILITHGLYFNVAPDPADDTIDSRWILNNFEPYKDKIRCIIQGHSHVDGLRYAWDTVPIVILDCDRFEDGAVEGTITEQSMSVLTIGDSVINVVKIGKGTDFSVTNNTPIFAGTQA